MAKSEVTGAEYNVHKRNIFYYMIYPYVKTFFFMFYGKVEVKGLENIPLKEPVIFAPNHQNALMDALIVLFSAPRDIVFLARADIFNKPALAWFLNSMKMLPVFRQRDGASELGKNVDIFDISVNVLHHRHHLCVMPEGNHGHQRKLRTIVKGIFRIAFKAQEEYGDKPFVKIVPVGIDMGHYIKQNQPLLIQYGKPIEMSDYWKEYEESNPRGINAVKKRLGEELLPLMIHIESDEFYDSIRELKKIFNARMREILGITGSKHSDQFVADKELIARIDTALEKDPESVQESGGQSGYICGRPGKDECTRLGGTRPWVWHVQEFMEVSDTDCNLPVFPLWIYTQCHPLPAARVSGAEYERQTISVFGKNLPGYSLTLSLVIYIYDFGSGAYHRGTLVDMGGIPGLADSHGKDRPRMVSAMEKDRKGQLVRKANEKEE